MNKTGRAFVRSLATSLHLAAALSLLMSSFASLPASAKQSSPDEAVSVQELPSGTFETEVLGESQGSSSIPLAENALETPDSADEISGESIEFDQNQDEPEPITPDASLETAELAEAS